MIIQASENEKNQDIPGYVNDASDDENIENLSSIAKKSYLTKFKKSDLTKLKRVNLSKNFTSNASGTDFLTPGVKKTFIYHL